MGQNTAKFVYLNKKSDKDILVALRNQHFEMNQEWCTAERYDQTVA